MYIVATNKIVQSANQMMHCAKLFTLELPGQKIYLSKVLWDTC